MTKFPLFVNKQTSSYIFSHFQIAQNGHWEAAQRINVSPIENELEKVKKFISESDQDIAIEAFFQKSSNYVLFFGIRIENLEKSKQIAFIQNFVDCAKEGIGFSDFISNLQMEFNFSFFKNSPDFLEVGAEGFWKSYGSLIVKKNGNQALSYKEIEEHAPQLLKPFERQMMLEHAYNTPMPHWLALPLSKKVGNDFILNKDRYEMIIDMLENTSSSC